MNHFSSWGPKYFDDSWCVPSGDVIEADVCVYGGTAAGVIAAVTVTEEGKSCVLVHPGVHLGGMTTGGLSYTDIGNPEAIGGFSRRFYRTLGLRYGLDTAWAFEPHVATEEIYALIRRSSVSLRLCEFLADVSCAGSRITELRMYSGRRVRARAFIDATYEGDLMAYAEVPYVIGRESAETFGEEYAGVRIHQTHQFDTPVSPYVKETDPSSGLLPMVKPAGVPTPEDLSLGAGDSSVQAYNFRVCLTDDRDRMIPFQKPDGYDRSHYVLAARWLARTELDVFHKFDRITEKKTDTNNNGAVSTDYIGGSHAWPEADYRTRELIFQDHRRYQQGLHWFMANDPAVPEEVRREYSRWGLAADEFMLTAGWPHQLYVREARRMSSDVVITEQTCMRRVECDDPIGLASYQMDSHNCNRLAFTESVLNEGDVQVLLPAPYGISYRSIVPPTGSVENLLVPVCVSASHIAFGSIRMEPVFMILAESAGVAVSACLDRRCSLQNLPYRVLERRLIERGQVLRSDKPNPAKLNP